MPRLSIFVNFKALSAAVSMDNCLLVPDKQKLEKKRGRVCYGHKYSEGWCSFPPKFMTRTTQSTHVMMTKLTEGSQFCSFMAKKDGFRVCPYLAGHGVGSVFHGPPEILHTGAPVSYYKTKW